MVNILSFNHPPAVDEYNHGKYDDDKFIHGKGIVEFKVD